MQQNQQPLFWPAQMGESLLDKAKHIFRHDSSAGSNPVRLAKVLSAFDNAMKLLKWTETPTDILTGYQASISGKYHKDYIDVATVEDLDRRLATRRSSQAAQQQQPQLPYNQAGR